MIIVKVILARILFTVNFRHFYIKNISLNTIFMLLFGYSTLIRYFCDRICDFLNYNCIQHV